MSETNTCHKCGHVYSGRPALSRKDGKTENCPDCGMREAIDAWRQSVLETEEDERNG